MQLYHLERQQTYQILDEISAKVSYRNLHQISYGFLFALNLVLHKKLSDHVD